MRLQKIQVTAEREKDKNYFSVKDECDNPGELMEVLLENSEAMKFLGDFIEYAISQKSRKCVFTCSSKQYYPSKLAITYYFVVTLSSVCHTIERCSSDSDNIFVLIHV